MSLPAYLKYIGLTILFAVATVNFTRTTLSVIESSKRLDEAKTEVSGLEDEKANLEKELEYKQSNEYVEKEARNKLGLVQPGEELFVVSQVLGTAAHNEEADVVAKKNLDNLHLWFELFL
ncbi:hypothetical protein A2886_01720 [candidate division WWE3 bacterium RIFCSPHIGHO2_01_FULL_42_13]|uniref:Septum formation initiator n=1 Tax=candidate division WWE3 bacterium RIFCSPHIGHO2_01_FULL_42_13 TaxID=1802617 RepID=A0A1F4UQQ5_UNCKA|nr:MAG: hypothetical protein A2886_01720 [candidate division WWE3 bacterium RIFCSPHIGHO2_01_FULL_42_13]